jgi:hypothetical protein
VQSRHSWVFGSADGHPYFVEDKGKYVCQHETDGKKCGHVGVKHPSNLRSHLRMHGVATPTKRRPPTRLEDFMSSLPAMTEVETWTVAFALNGWSFASSDTRFNAPLRQLCPSLPCPRTLAEATNRVAEKLLRASLVKLRNVTLCFDSGTRFDRYLVIVASENENSFVVSCTSPDVMTSENIALALATLFTALAVWEWLLSTDSPVRPFVVQRFKYMIKESVLLVCFFAPCVNNVRDGHVLEPYIASALERYDKEAASEFDNYKTSVRPKPTASTTLAEYDAFVERRLKPRWPHIALLVSALLRVTPTEAAVERDSVC